jgi:hypothetical protein
MNEAFAKMQGTARLPQPIFLMADIMAGDNCARDISSPTRAILRLPGKIQLLSSS